MADIRNYYQILGLSRNASPEDIRSAFRIYAAKFHPDKHNGDPFFEERFKEVNEAYEILSNTQQRWRYDIKTFGKSKVKGNASADFAQADQAAAGTVGKRKIAIDITNLDIYLATFYGINLVAWAVIERMNDQATPGAYVWGSFLSILSSFLMWLFIGGLITRLKGAPTGPSVYRIGCLLLALGLAYVILWTEWVS